MQRTIRPSDVHGPPARGGAAVLDVASSRTPRPTRRRWPLVAAIVSLMLVGIGLVATQPDTPTGPRVDLETERDAVAALALFSAQAAAYDALAAREDVLAPPGAGDAALRAGATADAARRAIDEARSRPSSPNAPVEYWGDPAHDLHLRHLLVVAETAREIAFLGAVHDTVYGGAGAVPLPDAQAQLTSLFTTGRSPAPLAAWAEALLAEMDGHPAADAASTGRTAAVEWWRDAAARLEPPATGTLRAWLDGLPSPTIQGLEGHPVAGPALSRLRR